MNGSDKIIEVELRGILSEEIKVSIDNLDQKANKLV